MSMDIETMLDDLENENDPEVLKQAVKMMMYRMANVTQAVFDAKEQVLAEAETAETVAIVDKFSSLMEQNERKGMQMLATEIIVKLLTDRLDNDPPL